MDRGVETSQGELHWAHLGWWVSLEPREATSPGNTDMRGVCVGDRAPLGNVAPKLTAGLIYLCYQDHH